MTEENEIVSFTLISIVFDKFKLDPSYSRGKASAENQVTWFLGLNWTVNVNYGDKDELKIFNQLDMYRKKDHFNIAKMHIITTYTVSKGISFATKYKLLIELCNQTAGHLQGAWRVKIQNHSIATILPQAYNKVLKMEQEFKKMIYENWE